MSQSRFSIVLVGVSALLRRPLVSRLRPADGERSPWVVFAARGCRFDSGFRSAGWRFRLPFRRFRSAGWPSGSPLPLFDTHRFGMAAGRIGSSAFRFGVAAGRVDSSAGRVGLRAHCFRFSARTDPHRRTAEARADGAHRHDTCFTSKHLSQHVNLPHRTP